jgi:hypothetical protein
MASQIRRLRFTAQAAKAAKPRPEKFGWPKIFGTSLLGGPSEIWGGDERLAVLSIAATQ